ncbi:hypothetical protein PhCBS80983_g06005 [Powellomyces hirtus]|uniref:Uncharacterized protein n=1 Tax=Powellomyces hirtus TaxID=109895 RepID=A0A507DR67_9FUNG|nr:hypothetical protein PhCBS80983_g06005 [Powellomyces hirtus]
MSVRQLNYTGVVNQPNMMAFQAISASDDATYELNWGQLSEVDGCKMRVVIAHQSMGMFVRACPEQFPVNSYSNDSNVFAVYPTLPFAGTYIVNVQFTLYIPNINVTIQPAQSTMFFEVQMGEAPAPVNRGRDQRLLGQPAGANGSYVEPWVWQKQVATLPGADQDPATWQTNGTFRVMFNPGAGTIKTGLCRLFTVTYYVTNASSVDVPTNGFSPYYGRDGHVFLTSAGSLSGISAQSPAFRISDAVNAPKWQPYCSYNQKPPPFEPASPKLAFGLYFVNHGSFNVFIQTQINGYIVTSSHAIDIPNPQDDISGATLDRMGRLRSWLWATSLGITMIRSLI